MSQPLTEEIRKRPNQWIALSHDRTRMVAASKSLAQAIKKAHAAGEDNPVMLKAPAKAAGCVF